MYLQVLFIEQWGRLAGELQGPNRSTAIEKNSRNPEEAQGASAEVQTSRSLGSTIRRTPACAWRLQGEGRIADLLRAGGAAINDARGFRLYKQADQSVRKRRGKPCPKLDRMALNECRTVNDVCSKDFPSDRLTRRLRIKCLAVTDGFSHECVDIVGVVGFASSQAHVPSTWASARCADGTGLSPCRSSDRHRLRQVSRLVGFAPNLA